MPWQRRAAKLLETAHATTPVPKCTIHLLPTWDVEVERPLMGDPLPVPTQRKHLVRALHGQSLSALLGWCMWAAAHAAHQDGCTLFFPTDFFRHTALNAGHTLALSWCCNSCWGCGLPSA